jgi:O-antigen/teichoic acid export membrane protein
MPFATRVGITAILGLAFTQLDKLVLSKALTLADYGYYMIAWMLSSMLFVLVGPVVSVFFPRLSSEALRPDGDPAAVYHLGCRLVSMAVMPVGAVLFFFSSNVLVIWIDQYRVVENSSALVSLLALGTLLNTLAHLPHALQLAHRRPQFGLYANVVVAIVVVPALLVSVEYAGAIGAAYVWVGLNALYVAIGVPIMHKWILRGHLRRWLLSDTLLPMGMAFGTAYILRQTLSPAVERSVSSVAALVMTYVLCLSACVLAIPEVHRLIGDFRKQYRN